MCNKIKQTCGESLPATCVKYRTELPSFSSIEQCDVRVEETIEELYDLVGELREETNLSALGDSCLEYVQVGGKNIVKNVLLKYETEICDLKTRVTELENERLCNMSIEGCNFDLGDLVSQCDTPIVNVKDLIQAILTKINE
jgi:hypothetical protein